MTDKQKLDVLKEAYSDIIWMAIRYAHGRHTYAPSMVRDSIAKFKKVFPDWKLKEDQTIKFPKELAVDKLHLGSDYLNDLFEE